MWDHLCKYGLVSLCIGSLFDDIADSVYRIGVFAYSEGA